MSYNPCQFTSSWSGVLIEKGMVNKTGKFRVCVTVVAVGQQ
jgi:hypothetical protein